MAQSGHGPCLVRCRLSGVSGHRREGPQLPLLTRFARCRAKRGLCSSISCSVKTDAFSGDDNPIWTLDRSRLAVASVNDPDRRSGLLDAQYLDPVIWAKVLPERCLRQVRLGIHEACCRSSALRRHSYHRRGILARACREVCNGRRANQDQRSEHRRLPSERIW